MIPGTNLQNVGRAGAGPRVRPMIYPRPFLSQFGGCEASIRRNLVKARQGKKRNVANVVDQLQNPCAAGDECYKGRERAGNFVSCSPWSRAKKKVTSKGILLIAVNSGGLFCRKSDGRLVAVCEHLGRL